MATSIIKYLVFLISLSGVQPQYPPINLQPLNPERDAVTRRFNYFDLELLKEYSEHTGNVFISPASIKTTLALILEGSKGKSAEEIGNALRIDDIDQREIREILERLLFDLNDRTPSTTLEAANSAFLSNKFDVVPEYQKKVKRYYRGTVEKVDYSNPNEATQQINSWVNNVTHGLINKVVSGLSPDTSLVLANALYFKGKWITEFNPNSTKDSCFFSPTRGCVVVPMMQLAQFFNYSFNVYLNAHAIELPYQDNKYSMLLLLPTNGNNVRTLARDMQHSQLHMIIDDLRPNELILEVPRFTIDFETDLVDVLKAFKINTVFSAAADLSGMIQQSNVNINRILHKGRVEVSEQGTKAAAVTSAVVVPLIGSMEQKITADKPFIFFIYHKESKNIVFEGIFAEPTNGKPIGKTGYSRL